MNLRRHPSTTAQLVTETRSPRHRSDDVGDGSTAVIRPPEHTFGTALRRRRLPCGGVRYPTANAQVNPDAAEAGLPPTGRCVRLVISATLLCNLLHNRVCRS